MDDRFRMRQVKVQGDRAVASAKQAITDCAETLSALAGEINKASTEELSQRIAAAQNVCTAAQKALTALQDLAGAVSSIKV